MDFVIGHSNPDAHAHTYLGPLYKRPVMHTDEHYDAAHCKRENYYLTPPFSSPSFLLLSVIQPSNIPKDNEVALQTLRA
jgi:hypothetical protein